MGVPVFIPNRTCIESGLYREMENVGLLNPTLGPGWKGKVGLMYRSVLECGCGPEH